MSNLIQIDVMFGCQDEVRAPCLKIIASCEESLLRYWGPDYVYLCQFRYYAIYLWILWSGDLSRIFRTGFRSTFVVFAWPVQTNQG